MGCQTSVRDATMVAVEDFVIERGPEAHATIARLRDLSYVFQGEGFSVSTGLDAPTACVISESGTLVDMLNEEDVDETDWRRSTTVRRFASVAARDRYLVEQPWQADARRRAPKEDGTRQTRENGAIDLRLYAGLSNSEVTVRAGVKDDEGGADVTVRLPDRPERDRRVGFALDEWARLEEELRLLNTRRWGEYPAGATDGLMWSLKQTSFGATTLASGCNSYPPDGLGVDPTPEFVRMLLAVERLLGREVWPGFDVRTALEYIPDERDRIEHLLLHGLRSSAAKLELDGGDPRKIRETAFEQALFPHLAELGDARRQINIKGVLRGWPGVGDLDIELGGKTAPTWVELKWAKQAGTLFNCLWDAGKLAQALREGRARYGYLVAGAPVAEWQKATPYSKLLLGVSCHHDATLVTEYLKPWSDWLRENPNTFPIEMPTPVMTLPIGRVALDSAGEPWQIHVARVEAPGTTTYSPRDFI